MYVGTFDLLGRSEDGRNTLQSSRVDGFILCCPSFCYLNRDRVLWERRVSLWWPLILLMNDTNFHSVFQCILTQPFIIIEQGKAPCLWDGMDRPVIHVCLPKQKPSDSSQIMALLNCLEFTSYNVLLCPRSSPYSLWFEPHLYGGIILYVILIKKKTNCFSIVIF